MKIQKLIDFLLLNPKGEITLQGKKKKIIGFAEFKTINLGEDNYFKIIFDDHSFLFIVPNQDLAMFTDEAPVPYKEIADEDIGVKKELQFRGKKYILDNANDYQYVIRLIVGDWSSIEGEVKFSDYVPEDGSNELLSLGWIVRTGERADVNPKTIDSNEISF
jgi:hypothetical protein